MSFLIRLFKREVIIDSVLRLDLTCEARHHTMCCINFKYIYEEYISTFIYFSLMSSLECNPRSFFFQNWFLGGVRFRFEPPGVGIEIKFYERGN